MLKQKNLLVTHFWHFCIAKLFECLNENSLYLSDIDIIALLRLGSFSFGAALKIGANKIVVEYFHNNNVPYNLISSWYLL